MDPMPHPAFLPLDGLDRQARARLLDLGRVRTLLGGDRVALQPDSMAGLHLVLSGAVALQASLASGRAAVMALLLPGDTFGGTTPFEGPAFGHAALSIGPSRLLTVPAPPFRDLLAREPGVRRWFEGTLAERARRVEVRLAEALLLPPGRRLERLLRDLASRLPAGDGVEIPLPLTQDLLAQTIGVTRETVNRSLRELAHAGRITRRGPRYSVCPSSTEADPW